jgi:hypothetical protein
MPERQQRIERFDRFQEPDRRDGVDSYDLDHPSLSGREVSTGAAQAAGTSWRRRDFARLAAEPDFQHTASSLTDCLTLHESFDQKPTDRRV